jgi:hypothetical protein
MTSSGAVRWGVAAAVALAFAAGAAPAAAGTYDVVSCGAPGAGGINRAWVAALGAWDPATVEPGSFDFIDECPGPRTFLLARSRASVGGPAGWARSAYWQLTAPGDTRISRIVLWRWGQVLRDDPEYAGDVTDDWDVMAANDLGNAIGLEACPIPDGQPSCETGSSTRMSAQSRVQYDLNTQYVRWGVVCNPQRLKNCQTAVGANGGALAGYPRASLNIWGSIATIRDESRPALSVSGALLAPGWRRPSDAVQYSASDASGIRSIRIEAAGQATRRSLPCDFHRPAPCASSSGSLTVPPGTPDGVQPVRVVAADAAGNETASESQVALDGNAPFVTLERPRGRTVVIGAKDEASGIAGGQILVRNGPTEDFRPLPTTFADGALTAPLDRGRPSRIDVRVSVSDVAGNTATGAPPRLRLTSVRIGHRTRRVHRSRVRIPFGRSARVRGRLTLSAGQPLAGVPIAVTGTPRLAGVTAQNIGAATTSFSGRFSFRVPPGPSRTLRFISAATGDALRTAQGFGARVPAFSTIHAARRRLSGPALVRFSGTVQHGRQPIPATGLVLVLQGREGGHWRTFADTRTDARGHWRARYRFSGRPGTYPIRVRIRRQNGFPFDLGYSPTVRVRVG